MIAGSAGAARAFGSSMTSCAHEGFHSIRTVYERSSGVLVFFWTCEACGERLGEARRENYRPQFDPRGNQTVVTATR